MSAALCTSLFFCFLYLFDTVDLSEKEAQYLWMIEYDYLHHCLLIDRADSSSTARYTGDDQNDRRDYAHRLRGQKRRDEQSG